MKNYRCAVMGQHPMRFPWGFDEDDECCGQMKLVLLQQIMGLRQQGVTQFLVACDYGIGLYAAEQINKLRKSDPGLMLFCITPHEEQSTKWAPYLRERYFKMLEDCTDMDCAGQSNESDAQLTAYKKIIDCADMLLTVFDADAPADGRAEDRALICTLNSRKPVINLDPRTLTVSRIDKHTGK